MRKYIDGYVDENVSIVRFIGFSKSINGKDYYTYLCKCKECGNDFKANAYSITKGHSKYCKECKSNKKNHMMLNNPYTNTRIYSIWHSMKCRCYYTKHPNYANYGGRGITVCDEWIHDSKAFGDWAMKNGYSDELTLDRINNDEGYSPNNCRWVTLKQQANNKTHKKISYGKKHNDGKRHNEGTVGKRTNGKNVTMVEINGVTKPLRVWLDEYGITVKQFEKRKYTNHWDTVKSIVTPIQKRKRGNTKA